MASAGAYTGDIHFFSDNHADKNYRKGLNWYKEFFRGVASEKAIGEKSVSYLNGVAAPKRIRDTLGKNVKLIAILRNPMERAYSSYWFQIEDIPKEVSFLNACKMEKQSNLNLHTPIIYPGFYCQHIANYLKYFDKDQLHVITMDALKEAPLGELQNIFDWLGVDKEFIPREYDRGINQAIGKTGLVYQVKRIWGYVKKNYPNAYNSIKKISVAKIVRQWIGKSSEEIASRKKYPEISKTEWDYLADIYYQSNRDLSRYLEVDLMSLWHKHR